MCERSRSLILLGGCHLVCIVLIVVRVFHGVLFHMLSLAFIIFLTICLGIHLLLDHLCLCSSNLVLIHLVTVVVYIILLGLLLLRTSGYLLGILLKEQSD